MTLGEFWKEYHTLISLASGVVLTFGIYKLPKWGAILKLVILFCALFLLTGLLGVIKYAVFAFYSGLYLWRRSSFMDLWLPMSMLLDTLFRLAQVSRLKRIVFSDSAPDTDSEDR